VKLHIASFGAKNMQARATFQHSQQPGVDVAMDASLELPVDEALDFVV